MKRLLLRQVLLADATVDVLIEGNRFSRIEPQITTAADEVIEAAGHAIVPPFYNSHCHAAMTLLRGFADDIPLFPWLENHVWPAERQLAPDDVAAGARLAMIEMIRSGTVFFNDMYWESATVARVADEMGLRAAIGRFLIEESPGQVHPICQRHSDALEAVAPTLSRRIQLAYAPHAIYTVSGITLKRIAAAARASGELIHIHAAETTTEVEQCQREHGMTPIAWLDACGLLTPRTILGHAIHLTAADITLIRERGATISHMPVSNAKLGSGSFDFQRVATCGGCAVTIGTDGTASNNSLSMFDELKAAALLAKSVTGDPAAAPAAAIWHAATRRAALAFGIDAGEIAVGRLADALLIDLSHPAMVPCYHLISNLVYAADPSVVTTVICDGRILMRDRTIPGAAAAVAAVAKLAPRYAPFALRAAQPPTPLP